MKAIRWKILLWVLIILKFLDIITTIFGLSLGAREMNPIGAEILLIVSFAYLFILYYMMFIFEQKTFHKHRTSFIKSYKMLVTLVMIDIAIYIVVIISNVSQLLSRII